MSVRMSGRYIGNKKMILRHEPSGAEISTDAPRDVQGDGSCFSPTDLVGAALGSCVVTTIGIYAERNGITLSEMNFEIEKQMSQSVPRKIGALTLTIHLPSSLPPDVRVKIERVGLGCPVHHSLHPDVKAPITFVYDIY